MSENKHTRGPWVQNGKFIYATGTVDTYDGPVLGVIVSCDDLEGDDGEGRHWSASGDTLSNARLIAAAPELLEAVKWIMEHGEDSEASRDDEWYKNLEFCSDAYNKAVSLK